MEEREKIKFLCQEIFFNNFAAVYPNLINLRYD
jgi:hypothetical protein